MISIINAPIKSIKNFIVSNKRIYLVSSIVIILGVILGLYLVLSEAIESEVYTTTDLELSEIVLGERGFFSLFFDNLWTILLPLVLIFLLNLTRFTSPLMFFYLAFQGILLGASVTTLISDNFVAGLLNSVFVIIPINIVNFFVVVSWMVVSYKRLIIAKQQRLSFVYSVRVFSKNFFAVLLGSVFASLCYAIIYPLLLKSFVVIPIL